MNILLKVKMSFHSSKFLHDKKFVIPVQKANFEESFIYGIED